MVNIQIDGKDIQVPEGTTVLKAARSAGIEIPTLCDHPSLEPFGGCRLCLVEVEGLRTMMTSCTLPVVDRMVVNTRTPKVLEARKFILNMLFSERNHFCPFCQVSGGDCELQNAAYNEDMTHWEIQPNWTPFPVDASHPHLVLDSNRCILCRRCIRACAELAGNHTLSMEMRGANTRLIADYGLPWGESTCVSCGSCAQVCPTGAIMDRSSAYLGHDKQLERTESLCVECSLGCRVEVFSRDNHLVRIDGQWDSPTNSGVLCQVGRWQPLADHRKRITTPMVRVNGALQPATWDEALQAAADLLADSGDLACVASTRLPAEALVQFKNLFRDRLGCTMVTTQEDGMPTAGPARLAEARMSAYESGLEAILDADLIVLVGADLAHSHQVAGFKVKRRVAQGAGLIVIDPAHNEFGELANIVLKPAPGQDKALFEALCAYISTGSLPAGSAGLVEDPQNLELAAALISATGSLVIIYGKGLAAHAATGALEAMVTLAEQINARPTHQAAAVGVKGEANSLAASQLGFDDSFSAAGRNTVFAALGDDQPPQRLVDRLEGVENLVLQVSHESELTGRAKVILPVEVWAETEGHYLNMEGRMQKSHAALAAPEQVRSNAAVLVALAEKLGFEPPASWEAELHRRPSPVTLINGMGESLLQPGQASIEG